MTDKMTTSASKANRRSGKTQASNGTYIPANRGRTAHHGRDTRDLIRQIIENVAVPELVRRHGDQPPRRRRKAMMWAVPEHAIAEAVELFVQPDCTMAKDFLAERLDGPDDRSDWLISQVLPQIAHAIEERVGAGTLSSALGVIGFCNLRIVAWELAHAKPVPGRSRSKGGRVALVSMADDAASFDLIPYEHTFWREGYEVENLEGVSAKLFLDTLHESAFDLVLVSLKRGSLRPILEKWIRAAKIVARAAPAFYSVTDRTSVRRLPTEQSVVSGCDGVVYSARDGLRLAREIIAERGALNGSDQFSVPFTTVRFSGTGMIGCPKSRRAVVFGRENDTRSLARH